MGRRSIKEGQHVASSPDRLNFSINTRYFMIFPQRCYDSLYHNIVKISFEYCRASCANRVAATPLDGRLNRSGLAPIQYVVTECFQEVFLEKLAHFVFRSEENERNFQQTVELMENWKWVYF
ncbi:hypothetical protein AVEN_56303-1 [Araneus ventricosus]|uniref:Uncharacterized protein n=1 Tax=Araneus ventricosus TaxID=182803 RepID=A0A4Y2LA12_ARAVE|nr:hypothetical protein AVEN_56303-1 [Araneus ventricosus]